MRFPEGLEVGKRVADEPIGVTAGPACARLDGAVATLTTGASVCRRHREQDPPRRLTRRVIDDMGLTSTLRYAAVCVMTRCFD